MSDDQFLSALAGAPARPTSEAALRLLVADVRSLGEPPAQLLVALAYADAALAGAQEDRTDSERSGEPPAAVLTHGAGRGRSDRPHYPDPEPEPETPPAWLGISLLLIALGAVALLAWTAVVVAAAVGLVR